MSRENVDRFLTATEAFNRGDVDARLQHFDSRVVFEPQVAAVDGGYEGHDGLRAFIATIGDLYEHFQVRLDDVRDLGDRVLAVGTGIVIGKKSGIRQEAPVALVATFRDGLITHLKDYGEEGAAFEAAGVSD